MFPFFPHHFLHLIKFYPSTLPHWPYRRITTPKNVSLDANVSMGRIVADGVVVTGRGGRLRGLIAKNEGVILMLVIVILSTLFLGSRQKVLHKALLCGYVVTSFTRTPTNKVFPHLQMLTSTSPLATSGRGPRAALPGPHEPASKQHLHAR